MVDSRQHDVLVNGTLRLQKKIPSAENGDHYLFSWAIFASLFPTVCYFAKIDLFFYMSENSAGITLLFVANFQDEPNSTVSLYGTANKRRCSIEKKLFCSCHSILPSQNELLCFGGQLYALAL